jgi:hypothetical protein
MANKKRKAVVQAGSRRGEFIEGRTYENSSSFLATVLLAIFMLPLLAIGGVAVFQGIDFMDRNDNGWPIALMLILLGLTFIGLWFGLLWKYGFWIPSVSISHFVLTGSRLDIKTLRHGMIRFKTCDVLTCQRNVARNSGLLGWWLYLKDIGWLYLPKQVSNAERLVAQFERT